MATTGDVVEVGAGLYSTPLLHWFCKMQGRKLTTYEDTDEFYEMARHFADNNHKVVKIDNWDNMDFSPVSVVLIDHHPEPRRAVDILNFRDSEFIVIHDTEKPEKYDFDRVWEHFKYVYHWKDSRPWTSVVSNKRDIKGYV